MASPRAPRQRRRGDTAILVALVVGLALILFADVKIWLQGDTLSRQEREIARQERRLERDQTEFGTQRQQTLEGCERLQILRVNDNRSHQADYHVFRFNYEQSVALIKAHPELVPQAFRKFYAQQLAELRAAYRAKTWVPLTDCRQAVNRHGVHYRSPAPVPFYVRPPPQSALVVPRAALR